MSESAPINLAPFGRTDRSEAASLAEYARILYRRRLAALAAFASVFIGTLLWTLLTTPVYEAGSTVQVMEEAGKDALLFDLVNLDRGSPVAAEMEIIRSRTVAEGVVEELGLDRRVTGKGKVKASLAELSVSDENLSRPYQIRFTDQDGSFEVRDPDDALLGQGAIGKVFEADGLKLKLDSAAASRGDVLSVMKFPIIQAVWEVQDHTRVRQIGDKTNIIRVSYSSEDPALACRIVNALVDIYRKRNIEQKSAEASQTLEFIGKQLEVIQGQLQASEEKLQSFKSEHGVMLLSQEAEALIDQVSRFEADLYQVRLQRAEVAQILGHFQAGRREQALTLLPAIEREDVTLSTLGLQLTDLLKQRSGLMATLTEEHPDVRALQAQIVQVQENIEEVLRASLAALEQREKELAAVVDSYMAQLGRLPQTERDLASLTRTKQVNEEIYTFLLQKHEEARIAKASTVGNIRVIDRAIVPSVPVKPKVKINLLLGLVVGLLAGLGAAFLLEFVDDSIRSLEAVERICDKPIYGIIPRMEDVKRAAEEPGQGPYATLIAYFQPKSPTSEAFRSLRTNLQFGNLDRKLQTLLITSAGPGEGKSTITSNLAVTMAAAGRSTLIVDADLRKPSQDKIFGIGREPGLTTILTGEAKWRDVIRHTRIEKLDLLASGPIPPNPTEIMSSNAMRSLLEELRADYESIVFDSPPIIAVADAAILGATLDATLLVVELGRARVEGVHRAMSMLANVGANLLGVVTNSITMAAKGHYGYYYYYYGDQGARKRRGRRARRDR